MTRKHSFSSEKIDAVLPLKENDFEWFEILNASLNKFFNCLSTCLIVTKDSEFQSMRKKIVDLK